MTQEVWWWLQGAVNLVLFKAAWIEKLFKYKRHCHDDLLLFFCRVINVAGQLVSYVKANITILVPSITCVMIHWQLSIRRPEQTVIKCLSSTVLIWQHCLSVNFSVSWKVIQIYSMHVCIYVCILKKEDCIFSHFLCDREVSLYRRGAARQSMMYSLLSNLMWKAEVGKKNL